MSAHELELWRGLGLALLFLALLAELGRFPGWQPTSPPARRQPRPHYPRTPQDCPQGREAVISPGSARTIIPYAQRKSPRGRRKSLDTHGLACPNPGCPYFQITDPTLHALIGYGYHGRHEPIRDFYCQACHPLREFTARRQTALYRLKSPSIRVAQVLHSVAEGLSVRAAGRVFSLSQTTIRTWLTRAGQHSRHLHHRLLRNLHLTHVQLDELRLKLRGTTEAIWLWIACDARTKLIPAFALGSRTQAIAHQLVHEVVQRVAPNGLPVFSSDGLVLYFYALTAHFGAWVEAAGKGRRTWLVNAHLLYAQVVKRYRRYRITQVRRQILLGQPDDFRQGLSAHGFSGRVQTAFIERLNALRASVDPSRVWPVAPGVAPILSVS